MGDRIIKPGMTGHDVRVLQAYLSMAGFPTAVDGQDGSTTVSNVIAFERSRNLKANGIVTWQVSQTLRLVVAEIATSEPPVRRARLVGGLAIAPSDAPTAVKEVIAAANRIAFKPYIFGGGHGSWNSAGYDCSGSVSYALHGGHLLNVTEDSDRARVLRQRRRRAGGSRSGPTAATPTCTSPACASTPPRRARPAARAGPRRAPRTPASSSVTRLSTKTV